MRTLPEPLAIQLASGVTTLAWCWRITRSDGVVIGLTEHDRDVTIAGVAFQAGSAEVTGAPEARLGLGADSAGLSGRLSTDLITADDIGAGLYAGALIDLLRVDWTAPENHVLIWRGRVGEITRGEAGFTFEIRGLAADLERTIGRTIQKRCDADLGDVRCGVDLDQAVYLGSGAVTGLVSDRTVRVSGLSSFDPGWFSQGLIQWTSGANAGRAMSVDSHVVALGEVELTLFAAPAAPMTVGDEFAITAGCDKRWSTCRAKFANAVNFRGFPMIPGDDWLIAGPRVGETHNGASLLRGRQD